MKYDIITFSTQTYPLKTTVLCGFDLIGEAIYDSLEFREVPALLKNSLQVIFDADWGFALTASLDPARPSIIVTDNPCPEYWEDLWDRGPTVLVAGKNITMGELAKFALKADALFEAGKRVKETPFYQSTLTKAERKVFWWAVQGQGLTNAEIAKQMYLSEQTVINHLRSIYSKLDLSKRLQLVLYYRHGDKGKDEVQDSRKLPNKSVEPYRAS